MEVDLLFKLLDIGRQMAETRALEPLMVYAVEVAMELINAQYGYLVLIRDDGSLDFHVRRDRYQNDIESPEGQISHTILYQVIESQQPLISARATSEDYLKDAPSVEALGLLSIICVPLISSGKAIGVIYFENRITEGVFSQDELKPLEYLASYVSIGIRNARLNEELQSIAHDHVHTILEKLPETDIFNTLERERERILLNFIQDASHQFRTPLSVIKNSVDLIERVASDNATQYDKYLNRIRHQVDTVVQLVDSLNMLAKLDSYTPKNFKPVDLIFVARDMVHTMSQRALLKEQTVTLHTDLDIAVISGASEYIRQALGELIENAIQYTGKKGQIDIYISATEPNIIVEVVDNGIGMHPAELDNAFIRFTRGDKTGTTRGLGLGLPIVEKVAILHNGTITANSMPAEGSRFKLTLPRLKD